MCPTVLVIDDTQVWHAVAARSCAELPWTLAHAHSGAEAELLLDGGLRPAVVLMDYFIGDMHGDDLTERIRLRNDRPRPCIIGFSSVPACSRRIVAAGGDLWLPKVADDQGSNPHLVTWLRDHADAGQ
jgi:CheY-like chemotaxis protein